MVGFRLKQRERKKQRKEGKTLLLFTPPSQKGREKKHRSETREKLHSLRRTTTATHLSLLRLVLVVRSFFLAQKQREELLFVGSKKSDFV